MLAHHEDVVGRDKVQQHDAKIGVDQAQLGDGEVVAGQDHIAGDQHGAQDQVEQQVLAPEVEKREPEARQGGGQHPDDTADQRDDHGVQQEPGDHGLGQRGFIVAQIQPAGEDLGGTGQNLRHSHEREGQTIQNGYDDDQAADQRDELDQPVLGTLLFPAGGPWESVVAAHE